jgi:hypothetical protein
MAFLGHQKVLLDSFGKNLLKRTDCVSFFVFVMVDCIFVSECRYRLIVDEFGFVLQLGKIVASIGQSLYR